MMKLPPDQRGVCEYADCGIPTTELNEAGLCPLHDRRMWQVLRWCTDHAPDKQGRFPDYGPVVLTRQEYLWAIDAHKQLDVVTRQQLRRKMPPVLDMPPMEAAILRAFATNKYQLSAPTLQPV